MLAQKGKNLLFIFSALALRPFRRSYVAPKRILIFQGAKLGDMVCTTPLFRAVKLHYPDAHLAVMGSARNKELLAGLPYVDEYLVRPRGFFALLYLLGAGRFDVACSVVPDPEMITAFICARIPLPVTSRMSGGRSPYETSTARFLEHFVTTAPHHLGSYVPREYLRLLEPIDIHTDNANKELAVSQGAIARVREMLVARGYNPEKDFLVGIAPSAGSKIKVWGAEHFAEVAGYLSDKHGAVIVIIAGPGEKEDVEKMLHVIQKSVRVISFETPLSIEELKALVSLLALYISSDTGPVHIAEALGIPSVDVLGAVDEEEISRAGPTQRVVFDPNRGEPALHVMSAAVYDAAEVRRQTDLVTVEMVIAAAEDLISSGIVKSSAHARLLSEVH